jgi:hypothetical protein
LNRSNAVLREPEIPKPQRDNDVGNPDWSPWLWLLVIPVVLPLVTPIYNRVDPELWGVPAFYWIQLVFVPMSAVVTGLVYLKTRKRVSRHD